MSAHYKIFDTLQDLVLVVDGKWNLYYGNSVASELFGVSTRRLTGGKPLSSFLEFANPVLGEGGFPKDEPTAYREVPFACGNGKSGWAQVSLQMDPLSEPTDEAARWILYFRNVSLEKTLHDKYRAELDQKEVVIADLRKARAQLEDYSKNLELMVSNRTAELHEANQLLAAILDSLGQGILVFDKKGKVLPFFSKICAAILETNPKAKAITDVLHLPESEQTGFSQWCDALFDELLPFEDMAALGPSIYAHSQGRNISLNYNPMRTDSGQLKAVVMVATDRTEEMRAKQEAEQERSFARMVVSIVRHRSQFRAFVSESRKIIARLRTSLESTRDLPFEEIARDLHTVKGGAASFSLSDVAKLAHESEQTWIEFLKPDVSARDMRLRQKLAAQILDLQNKLEEFLNKNASWIGKSSIHLGRDVEVPVATLFDWFGQLESSPALKKMRAQILDSYLQESVQESFLHIDSSLQDLAVRLGKEINPLVFENGGLLIVPETLGELFSTFIHVFRNALDHGLEMPEERVSLGKPKAGTIQMSFKRDVRQDAAGKSTSWLKIEIKDDGRGIDPQRIRGRLIELGRMTPQWQSASDQDIIQAVFSDDFSTQVEVSDISGRGMGLPALKERAEKMGGHAFFTSEVGQGSRLIIEVPEPQLMLAIGHPKAA
jgi:two-component system chemotaxis sensor kinase CheA